MSSVTAPPQLQVAQERAFGDRAVVAYLDDRSKHAAKYADVLVTSTEVLALNATPKTIVAAPGAGYVNEFLGALVFLDYNSAAYADDAGEDLVFKYTDASGSAVSNALDGSAFDGTADALVPAYPLNAAASVLELTANAAIVLHLLVGEWITGNSPLKVRCFYRTHKVSELESIA